METSTTGFFYSIKQNLLPQCGLCIDFFLCVVIVDFYARIIWEDRDSKFGDEIRKSLPAIRRCR